MAKKKTTRKNIGVQIDPEIWWKFRVACMKLQKPAYECLEELMIQFVKKHGV